MSTSYPESSPPTKRRRDDLENSDEDISIARHNTLYYDNGNIVLLSLRKDTVVTAFKVYKDFLLLHSPVFEGMLSVPMPPNVEKYDGVPLVRLQDEAEQLIHFLNAIYDPTTIPSSRDFYLAYDKVESIFKLSKKYQVDKLLTCMRGTLSEIWPQNLWSWDSLVDKQQDGNGFFGQEHVLKSAFPEPCTSIRLARDYDIPAILPAAFYHLLRSLPKAYAETEPDDGDHWGLENSPVGPEAKFAYLSRDDFMSFVQGSYAIRRFTDDLQLGVLANANQGRDGCNQWHKCFEALNSFAKKHKHAIYWHGDALLFLQGRDYGAFTPRGICNGCFTRYTNFMKDSRHELWNKLPTFFGLQ